MATPTSIRPTWNPGYGDQPTSYDVRWRAEGTIPWTVISGITDFAVNISGLTPSTNYEWQVRANSSNGTSDWSGTWVCPTDPAPPTGARTIADMWFGATGTFVDLTVEANRRKFISAAGGAQNLGADGSTPFGGAPPVFLRSDGNPATFTVNNGRGGAFSVINGPLQDGQSDPPGSTSVITTYQDNQPGQGVVGDYRNGNLYAFNPNALTDAGTRRRWLRVWRALPQSSEQTVRFSALNINMQTGVQVAPDANPQAVLRWSDDGGFTWSHERFQAVGRRGETTKMVKFNRLGSTRRWSGSDRIFELSSTDVFPVVIIDASLDASE